MKGTRNLKNYGNFIKDSENSHKLIGRDFVASWKLLFSKFYFTTLLSESCTEIDNISSYRVNIHNFQLHILCFMARSYLSRIAQCTEQEIIPVLDLIGKLYLLHAISAYCYSFRKVSYEI